MELLFYSGIVSITDWKYTKSVGIKNQVFWAGPCSYSRSYNCHSKRLTRTLQQNYIKGEFRKFQ